MGRLGELPRDRLLAGVADNMESLSGVTAENVTDELQAHAKGFRLQDAAAGLSQMPLLALTANDPYTGDTDALVNAIEAKGGHKVTALHVATDHSWSDHRIALESTVLTWLAGLSQ